MTTTAVYQIKPDFYNSENDCKNSIRNISQTNSRYKNFNQTHFTAGDEEQFERYKNSVNGNPCPKKISLSENVFKNHNTDNYIKYKDINAITVLHTFRYIFNKFKKGIFVQILNNKLTVFLPFSKYNFQNEWGSKIKINPNYKNIDGFLKYISKMSGYRYNPKFVNKNVYQWYANNCILRYDYNEGDTNVNVIKNMLEELCKKRKLPDIEFFINRRDFPILSANNTEPYNNIWDGFIPLVSHNYKKYSPILSMSKTDKYADILMPIYEDWARVKSEENIWFPRACLDFRSENSILWKDKLPVAIFRGSSTGCGTDIKTNIRLKLAYMSSNPPKDKKGLLDAGITKWNLRPRKIEGEKYLKTIDINSMKEKGIKLSNKLSLLEQAKYKYIVHVDGHVSAFRISKELNTGSLLLLVKSNWKIWFTDMLKPYVHYVPVKSDLSDIFTQIYWCKNHDSKCKEIAENAKKFYKTYLGEKGILDFMQKTLVNLKKQIGVYLYNIETPLKVQNKYQLENINYFYPETDKTPKDITTIPNITRCFGLLEGMNWIVNMIIDKEGKIDHPKKPFFQNKLSCCYLKKIANFSLVIKSTDDPKKAEEHIHENFIGSHAINNLLKIIPNFAFIFNTYKEGESTKLVAEKITGKTMHEYITSKEFCFSEYLTIILQLCLILQVAQNFCGFVHYDLTPWNIMLQRLESPQKIEYVISDTQKFVVETKLIPVLIDYGKSHVIYNNKHYGFIKMFNFSTIQDITSILLTSLYPIILHTKLNRNTDWPNYFKLINFFSNTKFAPQRFRNAREVKNFLKVNKRYSNLISSNKFELENLGPMDLLAHILKIKKQYNDFKLYLKKDQKVLDLNRGNSRQIFNFILSKKVDQRIETYMNIFKNVDGCNLPTSKNNIFNYYAVQKIKHNLLTVKEQFIGFLKSVNKSTEEYLGLYNTVIEKIDKFYSKIISENTIQDYPIIRNPKIPMYDETTFLDPKTILSILSNINREYHFSSQSIADVRDILLDLLNYRGKFQLNGENYKDIASQFSKLNKTYLKDLIKTANLKSLMVTATKVYKKDYKFSKKTKCDVNISTYKKIFKIIGNIVN